MFHRFRMSCFFLRLYRFPSFLQSNSSSLLSLSISHVSYAPSCSSPRLFFNLRLRDSCNRSSSEKQVEVEVEVHNSEVHHCPSSYLLTISLLTTLIDLNKIVSLARWHTLLIPRDYVERIPGSMFTRAGDSLKASRRERSRKATDKARSLFHRMETARCRRLTSCRIRRAGNRSCGNGKEEKLVVSKTRKARFQETGDVHRPRH